MTGLDWEKAKRRDQGRRIQRLRAEEKRRRNKTKAHERYQKAYEEFRDKHQLECFKCGTIRANWASAGHNVRGPWIICKPCVSKGK